MNSDSTKMKQSDLSSTDIVSKYMSLQEELGSLASFIDDTRRTLGGVQEQLPSASDTLTGVTKATERATHKILEHIEGMMEKDGELEGPMGVLRAKGDQSDEDYTKALDAVAEAADQRMMVLTEVMTELSFQDLTCQAIQKISVTMVEIERRILHLISSDVGADGEQAPVPLMSGLDRLEESASGQSRQELVDQMLNGKAGSE
ncbi:MAG: protein phosphatase CheZ [Myxococcota bacterium]